MWMYKVKKCNFYVSSSLNNDLKTCSYVGFCSIFWFQALLKNFLWVKTIPTAYLKGPPGSGLYIGNKIMVIQLTNPFLFMKTFIPPPLNAGFGNRFFISRYDEFWIFKYFGLSKLNQKWVFSKSFLGFEILGHFLK